MLSSDQLDAEIYLRRHTDITIGRSTSFFLLCIVLTLIYALSYILVLPSIVMCLLAITFWSDGIVRMVRRIN